MSLTHEEVIRLARLARFELSPEEIERFRAQLNSVLEQMSVLGEIETEAPVAEDALHGVRLRDDEPAADPLRLPVTELTELTGGFFTVPRMLPVVEGTSA